MRPKKCRHTCCEVNANYFKPRGIPMNELIEVILERDEIEALRLAHQEKLYQEESALRMKISRQTFGRILNSAHIKITDAILNGKALKIEIEEK